MINEFALKNSKFNKNNESKKFNGSKIKMMANDSLFYFALFLTGIFVLHYFTLFGGFAEEVNIGINEILVCVIGFINVFSIKLLKNFLKKIN